MKIFLVAFVVILGFLSMNSVLAHELLPKEIVEYLNNNPNATPEELLNFANTQSGEIAKTLQSRSTQEILSIINNTEVHFWDNAFDFSKLGVRHILSGPDHILFVLTLLLVFSSISEIVRLITAFTVAHSITLILAGTGILVLAPDMVEPLIALSIAVMALSTVFLRKFTLMENPWSKIAIVFFFGLFHGLGFAGLLEEIAIPKNNFISSLFAFNVGIEAGQLFIIGAALPVIFYVRNYKWYPSAIKIIAVIISVIAFYWFIERLT